MKFNLKDFLHEAVETLEEDALKALAALAEHFKKSPVKPNTGDPDGDNDSATEPTEPPNVP